MATSRRPYALAFNLRNKASAKAEISHILITRIFAGGNRDRAVRHTIDDAARAIPPDVVSKPFRLNIIFMHALPKADSSKVASDARRRGRRVSDRCGVHRRHSHRQSLNITLRRFSDLREVGTIVWSRALRSPHAVRRLHLRRDPARSRDRRAGRCRQEPSPTFSSRSSLPTGSASTCSGSANIIGPITRCRRRRWRSPRRLRAPSAFA